MTQFPTHPNPYEFAPLENGQPDRDGWDEDTNLLRLQPEHFSGRMICTMYTETPLFVHGEGQQQSDQRRFYRRDRRVAIPASSLKGLLRSVYEIVTDSCLSSLSDSYRAPRSHIRTYGSIDPDEYEQAHPTYRSENIVPGAYLPCVTLDCACPACRLFGMVETRTDGHPLAGRLVFSDALGAKLTARLVDIPAAGGGPHPWHTSFYFDLNDNPAQILGRKLYFHHRNYKETLRLYGAGGRGRFVELEAMEGAFGFTIDFTNLTRDELAALVYTVELEETLRHHLGYAKPYGLGTARIEIQSLILNRRPEQTQLDHFLSLQAPAPHEVPRRNADDSIERLAESARQRWLGRTNGPRVHTAFSRILAWPGVDLYQYPSFNWFRSRNINTGSITLAEYQGGKRRPDGTAAARTHQNPASPQTAASSAPAPEERGEESKKLLNDLFNRFRRDDEA